MECNKYRVEVTMETMEINGAVDVYTSVLFRATVLQ